MDSNRTYVFPTAPKISSFSILEPLEYRRHLSANAYIEQDQASDGAVAAAHTDAHLVNPWGMAVYSRGIQVADADSGFSTGYDAAGNSVGPAVHIPGPGGSQGAATGIVFNGNASKFLVSTTNGPSAAQFLYATEEGTIDGWATAGKNRRVVVAVDRSAQGASYKGLALANVESNPYLYAANFAKGRIDVFDSQFHLVQLSGNFTDPKLPKHYSPFNVQKIGSQLFVTYAKHAANSGDEIAGASNGLVDVYNPDGTLVKRFAAGKTLNAPWGVAKAPSNFGAFSNDILVGNFGDGRVNAFDPKTGAFKGQLESFTGDPISIDGLWGLAFGNGKAGTLKNGLYFTAGTQDEAHGLYGRLLVDPIYGTSALPQNANQPPASVGQPTHHQIADDVLGITA